MNHVIEIAQNLEEAADADACRLYEFIEEIEALSDELELLQNDFPRCFEFVCKQAESNGELGLHQALEAFMGVKRQIKIERKRLIEKLLNE